MPLDANQIRDRVAWIVGRLLGQAPSAGAVSEALVISEDGNFDSIKALELILHIEREFNIRIDDRDIRAENFRTLDRLVQFVEAKLVGHGELLMLMLAVSLSLIG